MRQNAGRILALAGFKRVLDAYRHIWVSKIAVNSSLWGADADEDVGVPSGKSRLELLRAGGFFFAPHENLANAQENLRASRWFLR